MDYKKVVLFFCGLLITAATFGQTKKLSKVTTQQKNNWLQGSLN